MTSRPETKDERRARKRQDKMEKILNESSPSCDRYIVCLKHGNKYSSEYVNRLHTMVRRNLTLDFTFVCFTENAKGIDPEIKILPLPEIPATGWWYKPMFFNPKFPIKGTMLYLDLDLIIFRNIDRLFNYEIGKFCIIRDFNRIHIKNFQKMNSSVFRINTGQYPHIYEEFIADPQRISRRYHGDQDWIFAQLNGYDNYTYWPDEWIQSYKWEMRGKPKMIRDGHGRRNFAISEAPRILPETCIAVFHGDPNPDKCIDQWCKDNWG